MKTEDHLRNINESFEVIKESIARGIQERQRNIGFNTSAAAVEMFEIFLHEKSLINPGTIIKHDWFNSVRIANEKLKFNFQYKKEIIDLICKIELKRNILCYGKQQPISEIESVLNSFNKLKELFESTGLKWN